MFHSNTERLIDYWRTRKTGEASPPRSAIDPIELATLLPQTIILGRLAPGRHVFRLAGGLVTDLHGRDLRQVDFVGLWSSQDRQRLAAAMEGARRRAEAIVATARGRTAEGLECTVEILLAPISAQPGEPERTLGLYQPTSLLAALNSQPIVEFALVDIAAADGSPSTPALRLAAVDGRQVA